MPEHYQILEPQTPPEEQALRDFAFDVLVGLSESPKHIPSKYLYDDQGSDYFQQIMRLDAYYATRCEYEIFETHAEKILEPILNRPTNIVDLGAGDGAKTSFLLRYLQQRKADVRYVPVDISEGAMQTLVQNITKDIPGLEIRGLVATYDDALNWLAQEETDRCNFTLFLGSNVGNFPRAYGRAFLRRVWSTLKAEDYLLVGFDLKKDIELLLRAYNDEKGITSAFNLNLLTRMNRELGAEFDVSQFRHFGTYNVFTGAMESYLVSLAEQRVWIGKLHQEFEFKPWEPVQTEYSYKYLDSDIECLAEDTGFSVDARFYDSRQYFTSCRWKVEKTNKG